MHGNWLVDIHGAHSQQKRNSVEFDVEPELYVLTYFYLSNLILVLGIEPVHASELPPKSA
jgi:hypothetical protein